MQIVAEDKNLAKSGREVGWLYECQVHAELHQLMVVPLAS